ncbi:hypothetical protein BDA99DRAFT_494188 [Phascolomyces articulosus]|uniref:Protein Zds1 C-terminal domain-containing protein n=1 Tax=Phascolomyces articulosus TaxID=60185 RepID=A0AAD5KAD9_9FUNG|nr:hypothetical protein BDA99DRAFT_494188 [Phascolomyces articulosus]
MSYNDPPSDFDKDTSTESTASDSDSPVSPQDTEARFLPGIAENVMDGKNEYTFDRHSTVVDDSRILAPPTQNRSLLRRSAFSARRAPGQDRRKSRRPQPQQPRHSTDTSDRMGHIPSAEPISLHDHPVSMSEWIDLGSASLEPDDSQHGILSRVHDAESQLFSKIMDEDRQQQQQQGEEKVTLSTAELLSTSLEEKEQGAHRQENEASVITLTDGVDTGELSTTTTTPTTTMTSPPIPEERKVVALRRSASDLVPNEKVERKSSWISGLLNNDKKRKKSRRGSLRRVDDARHLKEKEKETLQLTRVNSVNNNNNNQTHHTNMHQEKKRGLAAFLSRSLSLKAIATRTKETSALSKFNSTRAKTSNTNGSTTTSPQQQQQQQPSLVTRQYIHSYRLPIHVERAVYRLSHMKLANPRRPLHQQVVISNFMFWYLSIINPQPQYQQDMNMGPNNNNNAPWPYQQQQQQQQQQAAQQQHYYQQQTETNEATTGMINRTGSTSDNNNNSRPTPPKMSAATTRRFSDDSIAVSNNNHNHNNRRTSQSSSDEEDNVPLSHYRK